MLFMNKCMFIIFTMLFLSIPFIVKSESNCRGSQVNTGSPVYGKCNNGVFSGYFSRTGEAVYGDCQANGVLNAYDPNTGQQVKGSCEAERSNLSCANIQKKLANINRRLRQGHSSKEGRILRVKQNEYNNILSNNCS